MTVLFQQAPGSKTSKGSPSAQPTACTLCLTVCCTSVRPQLRALNKGYGGLQGCATRSSVSVAGHSVQVRVRVRSSVRRQQYLVLCGHRHTVPVRTAVAQALVEATYAATRDKHGAMQGQ